MAMPKLKENIALAAYSNYKIGGPARFFFEPKNEKEVLWAVAEAKRRKIPFFILGGGTNLLIDDAGFRGLVIRPRLVALKAKGAGVTAGAGVMMADLLDFSVKHSLSGLEWAGGLPGTVGGAVRGNAGCFGGEIKDSIASVRSLDTKTMKIIERSRKECRFGYRSSVFKEKKGTEIILDATLTLVKGKKREIARGIQEKIRHRAERHPLEYPNIGSIFKNVPLAAIHKKGSARYKKALREAGVAFRGSRFTVKSDPFPVLYAAKLISETGLRGVSFGGAMISAKHTNFIVNVLGAGSGDVKRLIALAKAGVFRKFRVQLEEEVQLL